MKFWLGSVVAIGVVACSSAHSLGILGSDGGMPDTHKVDAQRQCDPANEVCGPPSSKCSMHSAGDACAADGCVWIGGIGCMLEPACASLSDPVTTLECGGIWQCLIDLPDGCAEVSECAGGTIVTNTVCAGTPCADQTASSSCEFLSTCVWLPGDGCVERSAVDCGSRDSVEQMGCNNELCTGWSDGPEKFPTTYYWDGTGCSRIDLCSGTCSCVGTDCPRIFPTLESCLTLGNVCSSTSGRPTMCAGRHAAADCLSCEWSKVSGNYGGAHSGFNSYCGLLIIADVCLAGDADVGTFEASHARFHADCGTVGGGPNCAADQILCHLGLYGEVCTGAGALSVVGEREFCEITANPDVISVDVISP